MRWHGFVLLVAVKTVDADEGSPTQDIVSTWPFRRAAITSPACAALVVALVLCSPFIGVLATLLTAEPLAILGVLCSWFAIKRRLGRFWWTIPSLVVCAIVVAPLVIGFVVAPFRSR